MRFYVHDFYFQHLLEKPSSPDAPFYASVNIYFNFSKQDPGDGWGDLQYFNIDACNFSGMQQYFDMRQASGFSRSPSPVNPVAYFDVYDEAAIMQFLKGNVEGLIGKNERELIMNAMQHFTWQWQGDKEVMKKFFK